MKQNKLHKSLLSLLLTICLLTSLLAGCGPANANDTANPSPTPSESNPGSSDSQNQPSGSENPSAQSFTEFCDEIYRELVTTDTVTLHYSVIHPENYGIENPEITFGSYDSEKNEQDLKKFTQYLDTLKSYDYASLSYEDQLIYDCLLHQLQGIQVLNQYDYYDEPLGPLNGVQAEMPVLLAEYHFYTKEDVETYLTLLTRLPDYYKDIAKYEREKSEAGLFMQDLVADSIIEQCENFIQVPENNLLLECFEANLANVDGLTADEITIYVERNRDAVLNYVIPAYQGLIDDLTALKGTGKYEGGYAKLPQGKEYFEHYAQLITGSSMSMDKMEKTLNSALTKAMAGMSALALADPKLMDRFEHITYPTTDPIETLELLKTAITKDFPALDTVDYSVKYVHPSLQESMSPAFYLIPPIDDPNSNNIYINNRSDYDPNTFFTTLAHEGYPGHLFQSVYFLSTNPRPIRQLLHTSGYTEGWGTYAEIYGYSLGLDDKNLVELCRLNTASILCLYGLSEIGIHYKGWSVDDTVNFWGKYGISKYAAKEIYQTLLKDPGTYLPYCIGYQEFLSLRNDAEKELGDKFDILAFHTFLLDTGALPFNDIARHMEDWIKTQK